MLIEMSRFNAEVRLEPLNLIKVNIFHLQPMFCVGLVGWLKQAGIGQFSVLSSVTEVMKSREGEILLLDINSIQYFDNNSFQRLRQFYASKTVVVSTSEQLERLGGRLPENIGSLVSPRGALEDFIYAVLAVTNRSSYVAPRLRATWDDVLVEPRFELTNRQLEVLKLVAIGKTSLQIAGQLGIRPKTVENHRAAIIQRLNVVSAAEMVNEAHRRGIC